MYKFSADRDVLTESRPRIWGNHPRTAKAQATEVIPHTQSATTIDRFSIRLPAAAPTNIASTEATRLRHRGLVPPAREEAAARPVIVNVRTVVVKSATPSLRTVAFLNPMASAVTPMTPRTEAGFPNMSDASAAAINKSPSIAKAQPAQWCGGRELIQVKNRPPARAPSKNAIRATEDLGIEKSGAPASAKPRNTTLPVMLAVNTWPKAKRLTASTIPVVAVWLRRMYDSARSGVGGGFILWLLRFVR